jgi:hypothetical protein
MLCLNYNRSKKNNVRHSSLISMINRQNSNLMSPILDIKKEHEPFIVNYTYIIL